MQPDVFDEMDPDEASDLADRVTEMYVEEVKIHAKMVEEHLKGTAKVMGASG